MPDIAELSSTHLFLPFPFGIFQFLCYMALFIIYDPSKRRHLCVQICQLINMHNIRRIIFRFKCLKRSKRWSNARTRISRISHLLTHPLMCVLYIINKKQLTNDVLNAIKCSVTLFSSFWLEVHAVWMYDTLDTYTAHGYGICPKNPEKHQTSHHTRLHNIYWYILFI